MWHRAPFICVICVPLLASNPRAVSLPLLQCRRAVACMRAAYTMLREKDFAAIPPEGVLAVLVASLAADVASVGMEDMQLCQMEHPLALTYGLVRPQRQAAFATVLRASKQAGGGTDIFAKLPGATRRKVMGEWSERGGGALLPWERGVFCILLTRT